MSVSMHIRWGSAQEGALILKRIHLQKYSIGLFWVVIVWQDKVTDLLNFGWILRPWTPWPPRTEGVSCVEFYSACLKLIDTLEGKIYFSPVTHSGKMREEQEVMNKKKNRRSKQNRELLLRIVFIGIWQKMRLIPIDTLHIVTIKDYKMDENI